MKEKTAVKSSVGGYILTVLLAVVITLGLRFFVVEFVNVDGSSMEPTLHNNEKLLVDKISYQFDSPERGEIIICRYPDREGVYVKRVIGLSGETVSLKDGDVYINDNRLEDKYFTPLVKDTRDMEPVTVPKDSVFVMGDNRTDSLDSSSTSIGTIPLKEVIGVARLRVWPISELGTIY
ncbi:MAG: signal peptidase I [Christensenellales bacterium]